MQPTPVFLISPRVSGPALPVSLPRRRSGSGGGGCCEQRGSAGSHRNVLWAKRHLRGRGVHHGERGLAGVGSWGWPLGPGAEAGSGRADRTVAEMPSHPGRARAGPLTRNGLGSCSLVSGIVRISSQLDLNSFRVKRNFLRLSQVLGT